MCSPSKACGATNWRRASPAHSRTPMTIEQRSARPTDVYPDIAESQALWERARRLIPAGTQTLAKGPTQYIDGVAPKYLRRGEGAHVWDVDGNAYVDLSMAVGPLVLGYGDPAVDDAIRRQLD